MVAWKQTTGSVWSHRTVSAAALRTRRGLLFAPIVAHGYWGSIPPNGWKFNAATARAEAYRAPGHPRTRERKG